MRSIVYFILPSVFLFSVVACSETSAEKANANVIPLADTDVELLVQSHQEILLLKMMNQEATTRSAVAETRLLAEEALSEHDGMLKDLEEVAAKHAADLPMDITPAQLKEWQRLVRAKGLLFDKEYAVTTQAKHDEVLALFGVMKKKVVDEELRQLAVVFHQLASAHKQQVNALEISLASRKSRDSSQVTEADSVTERLNN